MIDSENVNLVIKLSSTFWNAAPKVRVYVDDILLFDNEVTNPVEIKWDGILAEGNHKIAIELHSKDKYQTVIEKDKIVKDQLLNIDDILFDDIDIGYLKNSLSKYYANQNGNDTKVVEGCINLGWNGRWELEFTTPVYIWLLENM